MILYTLHNNGYMDFATKAKLYPDEQFSLYINLTNRCNCNCTFCLRKLKSDHSLWLGENEPSVAEIEQAFAAIPMEQVAEIVICGFGEPTMRLPELLDCLRWLRRNCPDKHLRLNTNGLSDLEYGKPTASLFIGLLDTISISLNQSTPAKYQQVTQTRFGESAYARMLSFAQDCVHYIPQVVVTIVDILPAEDIERCRQLCKAKGLTLRIRHYET